MKPLKGFQQRSVMIKIFFFKKDHSGPLLTTDYRSSEVKAGAEPKGYHNNLGKR